MPSEKTALDRVLEAAERVASYSYVWDDPDDDRLWSLRNLKEALAALEASEPDAIQCRCGITVGPGHDHSDPACLITEFYARSRQ